MTLPGIPVNADAVFETYAAAAHALGFDEVLDRRWPAGTVLDTHTHPFAVQARVVQGEMWLNVPRAERYGSEGATYWVARRNRPGRPG